MPTVCKIVLDAEEYRKQLAAVVAETKAAAVRMGEPGTATEITVTADTSGAEAALSDLSDKSDLPDKEITVTADTSQAEAALSNIPEITADAQKLNETVIKIPADTFAGKMKKGLSEVRGELNNTHGGLKKLLATYLGGGTAIGLTLVILQKTVEIVKGLYDIWRGKIEENAAVHRRNAESIREAAQANDQLRQKTDGYLAQLQDLAGQEKLSNVQKAEAKKLVDELTRSYGNLGVGISDVTGRITGFDAAMAKKLDRDWRKQISDAERELKENQGEAAQQRRLRDSTPEWDKATYEAAAKRLDELGKRASELRVKLKELRQSDPVGDFRRSSWAQLLDLRKIRDDRKRDFSEKKSDDAFNTETDPDRKIANRRKLIKQHNDTVLWQLRGRMGAVDLDVRTKTGIDRVEAQKEYVRLQTQLQAELEKVYRWQQQIRDIERERNKTAAEGAKNLRSDLTGKAYALKGRALEAAGRGEEFARDQALRDAEKTKGSSLTGEEKKLVTRLAKLSWSASHEPRSGVNAEDFAVHTNSLTARGGFSGIVKGADTSQIAREARDYNKRQAEAAEATNALLSELLRG